jgi:hypothetical protein
MTLGRKRLRRAPARHDDYPDDGPIPLEKAWTELSRIEFAFWCRLCSEPDTMNLSKHQLAKILFMSKRRLDELMRGLHHKGYLTLVPVAGAGQPMRICITRKPALIGHTNFVNVRYL